MRMVEALLHPDVLAGTHWARSVKWSRRGYAVTTDHEIISSSRTKSKKAERKELGYIVVPFLGNFRKPPYCPTRGDLESEWEVVSPDVVNNGN